MSGQLLKLSADALIEMYPAQLQQIRAGLVYAVCGCVSKVNELAWLVKGGRDDKNLRYTYHVKIDDFVWKCDCDQYRKSPEQPVDDFLGYPCKHICKHIASAAICRGAALNGIYPEQNKSLYDQLVDLVAAQHLPAPKEAWFLPGTKFKLARRDVNGKDTVVLATGFKYSLPLVSWVTNPVTSRGMWILKQDSFGIYSKFVFDVTGKQVLARMEQQAL